MNLFSILALLLLLLLPLHGVAAVVPAPGGKGTAESIHIAADTLEANDLARQASFFGHVVVRRGDVTLYANRVTVYYLEGRGDVDRIEATGEVRIVQGERIATSERATLLQKEAKVILLGGAKLRQGEDLVQGEEVTVFLNEERSVVRSGEKGGRVSATFHPKEKESNP